MRSTERRWVLTAPEWTLRPQPPSFPSCSHFLLASQFVGRLSPVNWMFRRKWLVLNVCPAGLHFLDRPYAGDPGPNCHQACLRGRREQGCSRTSDESLESLHQLRGEGEACLSLQCLLPQHETQPAGIVHYSHLHSWREVPAIAAGCGFVNQILYFPLFLQSSFKEWIKCWTLLLCRGNTELLTPFILKHPQGYWNS